MTAVEPAQGAPGPDPRDAYFTASLPQGGLGRRTARSMLWTIGGQWSGFAIQILGTVFLARLLSPQDYGLYASVIAFTAFADQFRTLGLSQAVVQREHLTHAQVSGLFWVNVGLGVVLAAVISACAPLIAAFYGEDELVGVTIAASGAYVITGFSIQHSALLQRQLRFRAVAVRSVLASLAGAVASVVAALMGAGYWALVIGPAVQAVVTVVTVWTAVPWRPSRPSRGADLGPLLRFGGGVSVFNLLNYLSRYADNILIGRFVGVQALGLYSRAYSLLLLPLQQINNPVGSVVQASMSRLWGQPERYRGFYRSCLRGLAYVTVPLVIFFAVMADEVILVMLGDQWTESADVFRLLAIGGVLQVIAYTNGWVYVTSGQTGRMARWALVSRPLVVLGFVAGLPWGIAGVATGFAVVQVVLTPIGFRNAFKGTPLALRDVVSSVWRPYVLAGVMAAAVWPVRELLSDEPPLVSLLLCLVTAAGVLSAAVGLWRGASEDVFGLLASARRGR